MTAVLIRPTRTEYGLNRDAYDELVTELQVQGITASIESPIEKRGGITHAAADVAIFLLDHVTDAVLGVIAAALWEHLRGRSRPGVRSERPTPRRAAVFGPHGEVLKEIDLDDDRPPGLPPR